MQEPRNWLKFSFKPEHVHGPGCNHAHVPATPTLPLPKAPAKKTFWLAGIAAFAALGAYVISRAGKKSEHSARDREKEKTPAQHAEDIAYTINHSLYCTLTDFLNPPINTATDGWLRWLIPGCGHDHSHDGGNCTHHDHAPQTGSRWQRVKQTTKQSFSKQRFIQYAKGEFIGDFGAVPLTIATQRLFPSFMGGIRTLTEPVMRPVFTYGINRSSKNWAQQNHVVVGSQQYKDHVASVYEHEMSHFPQAVAWTGYSLGLNVGYQMVADKSSMPFMNKLALKSTSVLSGVLVTAAVVVSARAFAPHRVRRFDQWTSRNIILPATKNVGAVFGVKAEDVDHMQEKQQQLDQPQWAQRVKENSIAVMR